MKTFCKYSLSGGGNFNPTDTLIKGFLSLLFITTALTACNDDDQAIPTQASNKLNITVGLNPPQSRAGIITGNTLADGSTIGILLDDGAETDYDAVNNIKFTASTQDAKQVWTPASDIVLSDTKGTLYAYYPYAEGTDLSAIPVETASQTDYLYAEPVANVSEKNANVPVTMKHMLANVKIAINKGTYVGTGNISKIAIQSDGFATGGTFNAAQETPAYTATTGAGTAIESTAATTLGGTATDIMVVPTGAAKPITFTATIDDVDYTVTSSDVILQNGNSYEYTLSLNSTFMSVAGINVQEWTGVPKESLTLGKKGPWDIPNGVYAVSATGMPVDLDKADASCIALAVIRNDINVKIMITKNDATDDGSNYELYWGKNLYKQDVPNLEYLANETAAWADYNGKANTAAIIAGYAALGKDMDAKDICTVLNTFNATDTYNDWYIPSAGQLSLFSSNRWTLNPVLERMGGRMFAGNNIYYWSSSESTSDYAWGVGFNRGDLRQNAKSYTNYVRFVRDIN